MQQEINLLTIKKEKNKKISPFLSISIILLLASIVIAALLLLFVLFRKTTLNGLVNDEKDVLSSMKSVDQQRLQYLTIVERIPSIKKIISSNKGFAQRLNVIAQSLPSGMQVDGVSISGDKATVSVSSPDLTVFQALFGKDLNGMVQAKNSDIQKINISNFSISNTGDAYTATIDLTYNSFITE